MISLFPDGESMSSLYIQRVGDIALLNPVTQLAAGFEGSSTEATISFTAPTTAKDGTLINGDVTVTGYLDGMFSFAIPVAPGSKTIRNYTLEQARTPSR